MIRVKTFYTLKLKHMIQKNNESLITPNLTITYDDVTRDTDTFIYHLHLQTNHAQLFVAYPNKVDIQKMIFNNGQHSTDCLLFYQKIKLICKKKCVAHHGYYVNYVSSMGGEMFIHSKVSPKGKFLFTIMELNKNTTNIFQFKNKPIHPKLCHSISNENIVGTNSSPNHSHPEIHQSVLDIIDNLDDNELKIKLRELYYGNCDVDLLSPIEIKQIPKSEFVDPNIDIVETMNKLEHIIHCMQNKIISMQEKECQANLFIKNILNQFVRCKHMHDTFMN